MIRKILPFIFIALGFTKALAQSGEVRAVNEFKRLVAGEDYISARVLLRNISKKKISKKAWIHVRKTIQEHEAIGWDSIYYWEKQNPSLAADEKIDVNRALMAADELMTARKFTEAFTLYQKAAQRMKPEIDKGNNYNQQLYFNTLHSMARALFGAGRYKESLEVYGWIRPPYPRFRRVLFEKMWAGFHANKLDVANGAIASQYSKYFSSYLEPEAYLVQIYIYRKLCRKEDLNLAIKGAKDFEKALTSKTYSITEWVKSDFDTMALSYILTNSKNVESNFVKPRDRNAEKTKIRQALQKQFEIEKRRLITEMKKVNSYINLAVVEDGKVFEPVVKVEAGDMFAKQLYEYWPVTDREDWLDEVGYHYFLGGSECGTKR